MLTPKNSWQCQQSLCIFSKRPILAYFSIYPTLLLQKFKFWFLCLFVHIIPKYLPNFCQKSVCGRCQYTAKYFPMSKFEIVTCCLPLHPLQFLCHYPQSLHHHLTNHAMQSLHLHHCLKHSAFFSFPVLLCFLSWIAPLVPWTFYLSV